MNLPEWFQNLKPGDLVVISNRHGRGVRAVQKITKQYLFLGDNTRIRRKDMRRVGDDAWSSATLLEATPELIREIREKGRHRALAHTVAATDWQRLPLDKLNRIAAILAEGETP